MLIVYGNNTKLFSLAASVGAGSAGCALANRLTADGTSTVLLLEAGGLEDAAAQVPLFSVLLQGTDIDWQYTSERQHNASLSVDDQISRLPRGKVLGGSSSINHIIYARGNRKDFDQWASEYGAEGWSYEEVLPDFISIETSYLGIDNGVVQEANGGAEPSAAASETMAETTADDAETKAANTSLAVAQDADQEVTDAEMLTTGSVAAKRPYEDSDKIGKASASGTGEPPTKASTGRRSSVQPNPKLPPDRRVNPTTPPH
ncbi:hypothetical protein HPB49_006789 [Dermacentor silvarum]|uniref:Uncharacterized protein n=1 Tax=Dermacentor silvarum TaxID=543639 RepID=A0ACB8DBN0_DERSI|nr:hypothetical protein HPB49_006789 [Dermacentor silvarum]